jgi:hypothetical protein
MVMSSPNRVAEVEAEGIRGRVRFPLIPAASYGGFQKRILISFYGKSTISIQLGFLPTG